MFETSENHAKDVYSQQAESGELSQFQPISSGKMAITHYSKVEKKVEKRVGRIPPGSGITLYTYLPIMYSS